MNQPLDTTNFHSLLLEHARARPDAIAVADGTREITYAQFVADIEKVTRRMNTYGLVPGSRAVLFFAASYLHWLAVIAMWRLGVISVSVYNLGDPALLQLLNANVLVTERADLKAEGGGVIVMGDTWLDGGADALPPISERAFDGNQTVRILLSSGTTGMPKKIPFSNTVIGARIKHSIADYGLGPHIRFMSVVGLDTAGGFVFPVVLWAAGGSVAFYDAQVPFDQLIEQTKANLVFMSPVQAANIVDALPESFKPPGLTLMVAGGRMPQLVAERAKQRLASVIWVVYGSTEAGTVSLTFEPEYANPDMVGPLVATADLQIVDTAGNPVPPGTVGEVRMRGACCVTGYLDDPETSHAFFNDGWFRPGDLGTLSESRMLSIVGRVGDIMNLGGVKVAPGLIEDALSSCRGVKDLAAFSVPDKLGTETLWIAISASKDFVQDELMQRYRERFPNRQMPSVALLDEIPRNGMAKVQRNMLRDAVRQRIDREANAQSSDSFNGNTPTITFGSRIVTERSASTGTQEKKMQTVKINDKEYDFDALPDEVKSQLASLQYVEAELQRLNMQRAALQTARAAYAKAIGDALAG
ncbi:MAG TPA: AMP-binding protein [Burkholderiaceae bacterium]|jgi:acyl-CoA synthetase (AMP-forming)/AMP-acid ligase II